jgi:hypothetical protein
MGNVGPAIPELYIFPFKFPVRGVRPINRLELFLAPLTGFAEEAIADDKVAITYTRHMGINEGAIYDFRWSFNGDDHIFKT